MNLLKSCCLTLLILAAGQALAQDTAPLTTAEAAKKLDERVTVRLEVKSAALREGICFLNSNASFKDPDNFTLFIGQKALAKFREANIEDPAAHFKGKTVIAKGKVTLHKERPQIELTGPDDVKEEKKDKD